jgi:protein ImuB
VPPAATRTLALWCPDWPVVAARRRGQAPVDGPVAVLEAGRVLAASREARAEEVGAGLRRREAEARCPGITIVELDATADARAFEPVARAVEVLTPRLVIDRPGVLAFPTRGPSRYFGGDDALVTRVLDALGPVGVDDARAGVADGGFAARLAARRGVVVPAAGTPAFLAPWPVAVVGDEDLVSVLARLGIRTLGAFAALPPASVLARFGPDGAAAHRLARGEEEHPPALTEPPPDLVEDCELDPPAERVDEAAFAAKGLADRLLARLEARGLACTQVVVEAETEHGEHLARAWRHEGALTPATLTERVRWQLDGWITGGGTTAGLTLLRLVPDQVIPATGRQLGFWGGDAAAADRAARVFARLQGLLGPEAVATLVPQGGRTPAERIRNVAWGEPREPEPGRSLESAWPGAVPGPGPGRVLDPPSPAALLDEHGRAVTLTSRGDATGAPAVLQCDALPDRGGAVSAWAGPWAQDVRWWDRRHRSRRVHWQVVVGDVACLVRLERGTTTVDAVYD